LRILISAAQDRGIPVEISENDSRSAGKSGLLGYMEKKPVLGARIRPLPTGGRV
jgi:hypothetical protein